MRTFRDEDGHYRGPMMDVEARLVRETPAAFLLNDGDVEEWVPKSMVKRDAGSAHSIFTMPEWLAIEKGFA